jgi:hypothetical protein
MKLRNLTIGATLAIATIGIQSAAWSSTPNSSSSEPQPRSVRKLNQEHQGEQIVKALMVMLKIALVLSHLQG